MANKLIKPQEMMDHLKKLMIEHGFLNPDGSPKYNLIETVDENGQSHYDLELIDDKDIIDLNSY